jgi:hypothetical protein
MPTNVPTQLKTMIAVTGTDFSPLKPLNSPAFIQTGKQTWFGRTGWWNWRGFEPLTSAVRHPPLPVSAFTVSCGDPIRKNG